MRLIIKDDKDCVSLVIEEWNQTSLQDYIKSKFDPCSVQFVVEDEFDPSIHEPVCIQSLLSSFGSFQLSSETI